MPTTILCYGEVLWDRLPSGDMLGGAPLNLAFRVSSLGERGLIVSAVGDDELGRSAREQMARLHLDDSLVQTRRNHTTGTVRVTFHQGEPDYYIVPAAAYDHIQLTDELTRLAATADCLAFGTLAQRAPTSRHTLEEILNVPSAAKRFLDLNLRTGCYSHLVIEQSLEAADILKMNLAEAQQLARMFGLPLRPIEELCAEVSNRFHLECVVVTLGETGCFALRYGERLYTPGFRVDVVDTVGSGDAFSAGFLHLYLRSAPLARCCEYGCAMGALTATLAGPTEHFAPYQIDDFMGSSHHRVHDPRLDQYAVL